MLKKNIIDKKEIDTYANKIKQTENFENLKEDEIIDKFVTSAMKTYNKNVNNYSLLNEPNMNVNKLNPGLNNKNITNLINNTIPKCSRSRRSQSSKTDHTKSKFKFE